MTVLQQWWHVEQPYVDPYWANVRALLHFDGNLVDSKTPGTAWNYIDPATSLSASPSPVLAGVGSLNATANRDCGVAAQNITVLGMGNSDLCVEFFVYDPVVAVRSSAYMTWEGVGNAQSIRIFRLGTNGIFADISGNGPDTPDATMIPSVWNHVAVTRQGSNWNLWLNGVSVKSWINSTFNAVGSGNLYLGRSTGALSGSPSYYDELRVTVGVPRYTAPFTPIYPFPNRGA